MPVQVLVVDHDRRIRQGLRALIELSRDLVVAGEAGTAPRARELDLLLRPDVVVLDLLLPHATDGLDLLAELTARGRSVVAIAGSTDDATRAYATGAGAILPKGPQLVLGLTRNIRAVAEGAL